MYKKILNTGGETDLRLDELFLQQNSLYDHTIGLAKSLCNVLAMDTTGCVISGCEISGANILAGYVYYNNNVYYCPQQTKPSETTNDWRFIPTTTSIYPKVYQDGTIKNTYTLYSGNWAVNSGGIELYRNALNRQTYIINSQIALFAETFESINARYTGYTRNNVSPSTMEWAIVVEANYYMATISGRFTLIDGIAENTKLFDLPSNFPAAISGTNLMVPLHVDNGFDQPYFRTMEYNEPEGYFYCKDYIEGASTITIFATTFWHNGV